MSDTCGRKRIRAALFAARTGSFTSAKGLRTGGQWVREPVSALCSNTNEGTMFTPWLMFCFF
jgi:hypothetical protein